MALSLTFPNYNNSSSQRPLISKQMTKVAKTVVKAAFSCFV